METSEQRKKSIITTLTERCNANTPPFFKKLRLLGLSLVAAGGVLVASPVAIPAMLVSLGGYLIVAGSVATAVSQVTVMNEESGIKKKEY